jgi:F-type H+-transporting ATPase subunit epsilon
MAEGVFHAVVLTPEANLLDTPARAVMLRSGDGDLTVLDGHTRLITDVVPGLVRVEPDEGETLRLAVHGGYLQVESGPAVESGSTRVTLLAGVAERAETIDVARAERARDEARGRIEELRAATGRPSAGEVPPAAAELASSEEVALAECQAALQRAEVRLEVAGAAAEPA